MYQVELVWNREFNWTRFSTPKNTAKQAISLAKSMLNSGDGARVKKVRVINLETELIITV